MKSSQEWVYRHRGGGGNIFPKYEPVSIHGDPDYIDFAKTKYVVYCILRKQGMYFAKARYVFCESKVYCIFISRKQGI